MTDDPAALAAEIATHRPCDGLTERGVCTSHVRVTNHCRCDLPWPCLVRRLADARDALLNAVEREAYLPTAKGLICRFCRAVDSGLSPRGRDTYAVVHRDSCLLAPADGEDAE